VPDLVTAVAWRFFFGLVALSAAVAELSRLTGGTNEPFFQAAVLVAIYALIIAIFALPIAVAAAATRARIESHWRGRVVVAVVTLAVVALIACFASWAGAEMATDTVAFLAGYGVVVYASLTGQPTGRRRAAVRGHC
jgi:hypothetical protein